MLLVISIFLSFGKIYSGRKTEQEKLNAGERNRVRERKRLIDGKGGGGEREECIRPTVNHRILNSKV